MSRPTMGIGMDGTQMDLLDGLNTLQAILKDYFQGEESVEEVRMQIARTREQLSQFEATLTPPPHPLTPESDSIPPLSPTPLTTPNLDKLLTHSLPPSPTPSSPLVESPIPWSDSPSSSRPVSLSPFTLPSSTPTSSHHDSEPDDLDDDADPDDPDTFHRLSLLLIHLRTEAQAAISSSAITAADILEIISRPTSPHLEPTFQSLNASTSTILANTNPSTSTSGLRRRPPPSIDTTVGKRPGQRRSRSMADDMFRSILRTASTHADDASPLSRSHSPRFFNRRGRSGILTPPLTEDSDKIRGIGEILEEAEEGKDGEDGMVKRKEAKDGKEVEGDPADLLEGLISELLGIGEARREEERFAGVVLAVVGLGLVWIVGGWVLGWGCGECRVGCGEY